MKKRNHFNRKQWTKKGAAAFAAVLFSAALSACGHADPNEVAKHKDAGITEITDGDYGAAVAAFDTALSFTGLTVTREAVDINYYKAAAQYLGGDFDGAIETYTALLSYDKKSADPYFLRGCLYADEHEIDKAVSDFKEAIAIRENDYELYIGIYNQLSALGYEDEALRFLNLALEAEGADASDDIGRGRVYLILNQYDAAEKALMKALDKGNALANLYLAEVHDRQGEKETAKAYIETYAASAEVTSESLNALGTIEMENREYEEALETFRRALALENVTNEKTLLKNEIAALEYCGQFPEAYIKAQEFLTRYPNEQDMKRELTFLLTRFEGPYRE